MLLVRLNNYAEQRPPFSDVIVSYLEAYVNLYSVKPRGGRLNSGRGRGRTWGVRGSHNWYQWNIGDKKRATPKGCPKSCCYLVTLQLILLDHF
jgi:hypothetical protein